MAFLLDVNLLVALAWPNHVHHRVALSWFRRNQATGWATCPLTESSFVRVSSNPAAVSEAKSPQETLVLLRRIVALPHHEFWQDDVSFASAPILKEIRLSGYRQVTDAHLLALAIHRGGRLATLDGRIRGLVPQERSPSDVVCPVLEEDV